MVPFVAFFKSLAFFVFVPLTMVEESAFKDVQNREKKCELAILEVALNKIMEGKSSDDDEEMKE